MDERTLEDALVTNFEEKEEVRGKKGERIGQVFTADSLPEIQRLPSGVFAFDYVTKGGLPLGKISLIWGEKSASKSTFALRVAKSFLKRDADRKVLYFDFENTFDKTWAQCIFDGNETLLKRIYVAKPYTLEEGLRIFHDLVVKPEDFSFGLVVVDSVASMVTESEYEEATISAPAVLARHLNLFLKRILVFSIKGELTGKPVTTLLINQARQGFGAVGLPTLIKPGGKFQESIASLEVKFSQAGVVKGKDSGRPLAARFSVTVEKNKVGGLSRLSGEYEVFLEDVGDFKRGETSCAKQIVSFLSKVGLLEKDGKGYQFLDRTFSTQKEMTLSLKNDESFREEVVRYLVDNYYSLSDKIAK